MIFSENRCTLFGIMLWPKPEISLRAHRARFIPRQDEQLALKETITSSARTSSAQALRSRAPSPFSN
jgi:hypothetical protein